MSRRGSPAQIIREHKAAFVGICVALLVLELAIFAVAAVKSGERYSLQLLDDAGNLVYETDGKNLSDFNRYHFEKTYGSLKNYHRKLVKQDAPFPFRAWFVAAVGLPLGIFLFLVFLLKAYAALFHGEEPVVEFDGKSLEGQGSVGRLVGGVRRFNIFLVGLVVFLAVIAYWVIPNLLAYLGTVGIETVVRFRWAFLFIGLALFGLLVWIIYLRFLLARKAMDDQHQLDKYRLQLEHEGQVKPAPRLEHRPDDDQKAPLVAWQKGQVFEEKGPD